MAAGQRRRAGHLFAFTGILHPDCCKARYIVAQRQKYATGSYVALAQLKQRLLLLHTTPTHTTSTYHVPNQEPGCCYSQDRAAWSHLPPQNDTSTGVYTSPAPEHLQRGQPQLISVMQAAGSQVTAAAACTCVPPQPCTDLSRRMQAAGDAHSIKLHKQLPGKTCRNTSPVNVTASWCMPQSQRVPCISRPVPSQHSILTLFRTIHMHA
jgi:hypothetical protein